MFDEQEIEALALGARIVESWADRALAEAAGNVIAKVEAVVPERLRRHLAEATGRSPGEARDRAHRRATLAPGSDFS